MWHTYAGYATGYITGIGLNRFAVVKSPTWFRPELPLLLWQASVVARTLGIEAMFV